MRRFCERPGCSEVAAVAYGMRPEDLVFWLDGLTEVGDAEVGVLCLRHADAMVVPRNWTLDDHRDPDLHLFRPPPAGPPAEIARGRRRRTVPDDTEQLAFGAEFAAAVEAIDEAESDTAAGTASGSEPEIWAPAFDPRDDLGGLLSARSPLLARAFRGADRPRR